MIETVIALRPRDEWPKRHTHRWYSDHAPHRLKPGLATVWPEDRARSLSELSRDLGAALRMPGSQMAIAPPIRTRIDMLTCPNTCRYQGIRKRPRRDRANQYCP